MQKPSSARSILAGCTAGAVEVGKAVTLIVESKANYGGSIAITYPAECESENFLRKSYWS